MAIQPKKTFAYRPSELDLPPLEPIDVTKYQAPLSEFGKGIRAFADETQAQGGALVSMAAEGIKKVAPDIAVPSLDAAAQWGMDVYRENMEESVAGRQAPKVARIEDIKSVGDFGDWAAYQGTKGLGTVAGIALSGGVAGAAAKGALSVGVKQAMKEVAGKAAERTLTKQLGKEAVEKAAKRGAQAVTGAQVGGATAAAFGLEGGSAFGQQVEEGVAPEDAVGPAATVGAINAALELTPFGVAARYLGLGKGQFKSGIRQTILNNQDLRKKAASLANVARKAAAGGAAGLAAEGLTEGIQELVQVAGERWAKDEDLFAKLDNEQLSQIANAMAVGALVGGTIGAPVGAARGTAEYSVAKQIEEEIKKREAEAAAAPPAAAEEGTTQAAPAAIQPAGGEPAAGPVPTVAEYFGAEPDAGLTQAAPEAAGYQPTGFVSEAGIQPPPPAAPVPPSEPEAVPAVYRHAGGFGFCRG